MLQGCLGVGGRSAEEISMNLMQNKVFPKARLYDSRLNVFVRTHKETR